MTNALRIGDNEVTVALAAADAIVSERVTVPVRELRVLDEQTYEVIFDPCRVRLDHSVQPDAVVWYAGDDVIATVPVTVQFIMQWDEPIELKFAEPALILYGTPEGEKHELT